MSNIETLSDFTPQRDQDLVELVQLFGEDWKKIQLEFIKHYGVDIKSPQLIQNRFRYLQEKQQTEQESLNEEEQNFCWLAGIKACSLKIPIFGVDLQKNSRTINKVADSTIYIAIQCLKEEGGNEQFKELKQNIQRMLAIVTYLMMTKAQNFEQLLQFCTQEQFKSILNSLSELDLMREVSLDPIRTSEQISKSYCFQKLFKFPIFDPFTSENQEKSQTQSPQQQYQQQQQQKQQKQENNPVTIKITIIVTTKITIAIIITITTIIESAAITAIIERQGIKKTAGRKAIIVNQIEIEQKIAQYSEQNSRFCDNQ